MTAQQQKHLTSKKFLKYNYLRISKTTAHINNVIIQKTEAALAAYVRRIGLNILHAPQKFFLSK